MTTPRQSPDHAQLPTGRSSGASAGTSTVPSHPARDQLTGPAPALSENTGAEPSCDAGTLAPMRENVTDGEIPVTAQRGQDTRRERSAAESRALDDPAPGSRIGQYEIIRLLGRGGMGEVYLARDLRLGRLVAIKRLAAHGPGLAQRFLAEARATARCHHESIVVIHEVGEDDEHGGHPYMVLEYLEGQTLRQWLREHAASAGEHAPVPPGRAVELMVPVVRALAYAHARGIVHRDLKPENVMITRSGAIKVLDFGIAKLLCPSGPDEEPPDCVPDGAIAHVPGPMSENGSVHSSTLIGTLPYMSPEQMNVGAIDHRSDVWTVGIMLFELVAGRHPMPARSVTNLMRIADEDEPMPSVAEVAPDLAPGLGSLVGVIDRCLLKRPQHRTPSARVLLAELEALAPGRGAALVGDDGSPFAGLAAFQEADAPRFFGRDRDVVHIVNELHSRPLVAVVGPSGTGKSSLVRAGVIPALKRSGEGWDAHVVRPGRDPLAALAGILAQAHGATEDTGRPDGDRPDTLIDSAASAMLGPVIERLRAEPGYLGARLRARASSKLRRVLVFVDQLEELYTLGAPPDARAAFRACLAAVADDAASPLRVVLSMRSDFLGWLTEDPALGAEVARGLVLLPPMDRDGMRQALLRPVEANGHRFESPALVDRMIDALDATPGALPLLQFTAARLWELRDTGQRLLTCASYEQLGGVAGALATHADAVLAGMSASQRTLARAVLERLVTPERTRALVRLADLRELQHAADAVDHVVQHLAGMRLLVIERDAEGEDHVVELAHDSLIDRWPTLAGWLTEHQDEAAFLARLRGAAQEWEKGDRDEGLLWRGAPAQEALLWHARYCGALPRREQDYLHAVLSLDKRTTRARRLLVAGTILSVLLVVVVWMWNARQEARKQAELTRHLQQALLLQRVQNYALEQTRSEAVAARRSAEQQAAKAQAALEEAEQARDGARAAAARASAEKARAHRAAEDARQAQVTAQQAEARTRAEKAKADQAAREAAESERDKQEIIDRAVGDIHRDLGGSRASDPEGDRGRDRGRDDQRRP
ncbi:MAG TPA: serine/threonine-protein kinase [Haliangium sp.]|nr:serine/threonine-protein kinase [Haliangium sp.]